MKRSVESKWGTIFQNSSTTRVEIKVDHKPGSLSSALEIFEKNKVNLKKIDSQPDSEESFKIFCDIEGTSEEENISNSIKQIKEIVGEKNILVMGSEKKDIPWFPRKPSDLDLLGRKTMEYGSELDSNHPGFKDEKYRERRRKIAEIAQNYKHGEPLPTVEYTEDENKTWGIVYNNLKKLYPTHSCKEHNKVMPLLEKFAGYGPEKIPQLNEVSEFLESCTGWVLRPVAGLLSTRDFINALAFRIFHSTQYIRHSSVPMYTPEPDVIHELVGHVPLLADPAFANFSQAIGLASLGASDEDIERLGTMYWFTIEFGLCKEKDGIKAYGAGILSSFGELEHALSDKPEKVAFDPFVASTTKYNITEFQMKYFVTESFQDALSKVENFAHHLERPFSITYDPYTRSVDILDNKEKTLNYALKLKSDFDNLVEALKKL
eukprot:TRINITY_DN981_c0_g1_i1.p1 TRINITY_DN981_c0_g1~~TRINITY_DN981_c0_g1_i1.p1  ORF type:complete len:434 (-),score=140.13 TRINITY_DN981_c0_g1_i1:32-1333(-)